ncbi:CRT (chloroquine-resistance transporter)-like transporter [Micractinium conductrix]|uniref:CRT (Chloroquine-resistance transporter)-like transporter n=1 Tax=Micractinium conductrix TaxID=554055 RepID=A0A2P6V1Y0_9CHLO|nr:CRT (chloroquine-resistance transporter)-like transporter [Micractinium conductrix]|eukprot:PSC68097.1 CRT (chloroquine-resistance transporter)-like transporter [Micractinium conductrix]
MFVTSLYTPTVFSSNTPALSPSLPATAHQPAVSRLRPPGKVLEVFHGLRRTLLRHNPSGTIPRDWLYIGKRGITALIELASDAGVTTSTIANVAHYPVSPHEMYGAAPGGNSYPPVHFDTTSLCHTGSVAGTIADSLDLRDIVWLDATPFVAPPGAGGSVHDEEVFDKVRRQDRHGAGQEGIHLGAVANKTGVFDRAKPAAAAPGAVNFGQATVANKTGLFDRAKVAAAAPGAVNFGQVTVANKRGLFDPAKASAVVVGRSNGGKTAGTSAVANKTGVFDPARIQAAKNCRASADPRHCHRVLIVDKHGTVVHCVDLIGATAYQSKSSASKQCVKGGTAMKFRQTGVHGRVCWPAYLEPAPVRSELVDGLRAIMGIYEAGPPPQQPRAALKLHVRRLAPLNILQGFPLSGSGRKGGAVPLHALPLPWQRLLSPAQLRRGLSFYGSGRRIERVAARLLAGKPIKAITLGGSVTSGAGASNISVTSFPALFFTYLNATFPHSDHEFTNKAIGGTTSGIFAACAKQMVPPGTDLAIVEFSFNEFDGDFDTAQRRGFERLLRTLARLPRAPAVIVLHHYAWWFADGHGQSGGVFYAAAEAPLSTMAQYYDMPSPSLRNAIYHDLRADVAPFRISATHIPSTTRQNVPTPVADPQQQQDFFYLDGIHPADTGHQALAELLVGVVQTAVQHVVEDGRMAEGGEAAPGLAPLPLPPPMIPGNADVPTSLCAMQEDFKPLARAMQGFAYLAERPDKPTFVQQKWGYRGEAPGAWLELAFGTEEAPGRSGEATVLLGHLRSYQGMGMARVECASGCTCAPSDVDGLWEQQVSLMQLHAITVTQHPACVLRITIVARNARSSDSSSSGDGGGNGNTTSSGSGAGDGGGSGGDASGSKFQVSALVVAHQPIALSAYARQPASSPGKLRLLVTVLIVTTTAVANRVLYKMSLVPLSNYVFFLAQLQTFGYLAVYFGVLALRHRTGRVSTAMLRVPASMPRTFLAIGFVEALASLLGFLGAANLPGVVLPLLSQTILLWQVLLAVTLLRKRLGAAQLLGVVLVMGGVCLAAWPAGGGSPLTGISPFYALVFSFSMLFPALDTILKERVFRQARQELGTDLDLFVVNSAGSLAQAGFVCLLLPVLTTSRGMSVAALPDYLAQGWSCIRGLTPSCGSDCSGAPLLPLLYVATNLCFNVAALELIRQAGNVAMSLTMSAIVPVTVLAFTVHMPHLPAAPPLGPLFALGTLVLLGGLVLFNAPLWLPALSRAAKAWVADNGGGGGSGRLAAVTRPK